MILIPALTLAQEATDTPIDTPTSATASDMAIRAEAAADRAAAAMADAQRYANDASNYLGVFESVGVAIAVLVPIGAVIAAALGLNQLRNARAELTEARRRIENEILTLKAGVQDELKAKQQELDALKEELQRRADEERVKSEQATLALALLPLGERQFRVDDFQGALDTYRRALALDPNNMVIHYRLGYVYTHLNQLDDALAHLNRALEIEPDFAPALANLGYVLRRKAEKLPLTDVTRGERLAEAEQKLRHALALSPRLVDEDGESWWGSLGGLHRRRGQIDDAIDAYTRALAVTPQASYPLINLTMLHLQKGDREGVRQNVLMAERTAARRTLVDVTDFWAWADLLVAQLIQRKFAEATDTLNAMLRAVPSGASDLVAMPLDTLRELQPTFKGDDAAKLMPFIERLDAFLQPAPAANPTQ